MPTDAHFNVDEALQHMDGDEELLRDVAEIFLETLPEFRQQIQDALRTPDAEALHEAAHSLKGAVGNFGDKVAYRAALDLEEAARDGDLTKAQQLAVQLNAILAPLVREMQTYLGQPVSENL